MSLTDEILKQNKEKVFQLIESGEPVDGIDIYGFTPLIEAAIADDLEIAQKLIEYGADTRMRDLIGGTALQWAVENNNLELCKLLLDKGADPNAYSKSGQPILVQPILRRQQNIKELLYQYGADLRFAQDYITAKLLGHRFELAGRVDIVDHKNTFIEIDFEGFVLEFTLGVILESIIQLKNNFAGRALRPYFEDLDAVIDAFSIACELNRYQQYLLNRNIHQYTHRLSILSRAPFLILPVGYEGHAITFVKCGNLLAKCDRGANSLKHPSVEIFSIGNTSAFNAAFLKKLLYQRQNLYSVGEGIMQYLDLESVGEIPLPSQLIGNCSWANTEAAIPTLIWMRWLQDNLKASSEDKLHQQQKALYIYQRWICWDNDWSLHQCIETFYDTTPLRKASRAAILAAVLVQACKHNRPEDMEYASKILSVLATPQYRYILESYLKVYKKTKLGENLRELIDIYGNK